MPLNESTKFYDFIIYLLIGVTTLFVTLIGVLYNLIWKNIKDLWTAKDNNEQKVSKNSEKIAAHEAILTERGKKGKK